MIQHVITIENETKFDSFIAFQSSDAISMDIVPTMKNLEEKNLTLIPIPTLGPPTSKANGMFKTVSTVNDKSISSLKSKLTPKYSGNRIDQNISISLESIPQLLVYHFEIESNCSLNSWSIPVEISEEYKNLKFGYKFRHVHGYHDLEGNSKRFDFSMNQHVCGSNSTEIRIKIASIYSEETVLSDTLKESVELMPDWTSTSPVMVLIMNKNIK